MTSDGWKLVPVEPTRKMLDEGGFYFIQGGGSVSDSDMAQAKRVYRAMLTAAPAAPQAAGWTDRHTSVTRFALWRFINDAYAQANYAAQRISREPVENVAKFQDDARTAEEARAMLAAAPAAPQAQPKREPLSDTMVIACARVAIARIQPDEWIATDADLIDFTRAVERAHGIGGSDAE